MPGVTVTVADPETLLILAIGAGVLVGLPVMLRYLPAWYREAKAAAFLAPAIKHFRSRENQ
jgi:hypothetical protein